MTLLGLDVSHHQGSISWGRVHRAGATFAIVKATEGTGFRDSRYAANIAGAHEAGLIVGAYHFARPGAAGEDDARAEARWFLSVAAAADFHVCDIEDDRVPAGRRLDTWLAAWLGEVEAVTGKVPWLYSYAPYWREHGSAATRWKRHPWWLADYSAPPGQVAPWGGYTVWQYTSSGRIDGVDGRCDLNRYDGTIEDLRQLVHGSTPPPPPPLPDPTTFPGDKMTRVPVRVPTDGQGRGYTDLTFPHTRVVSIVLGGDEPADGWGPFVASPAYAIDYQGRARIVVPESPVVNGHVDLAVWRADS